MGVRTVDRQRQLGAGRAGGGHVRLHARSTRRSRRRGTRGMRLVLIWFGAFKNAGSTYAPGWVRADPERFPRAVVTGQQGGVHLSRRDAKPVLSVFSAELLDADRRAFVAFMGHLAEVDPEHIVVMVQVENEVGLLRDSRDRSPGAEAAWRSRCRRRCSTTWRARGTSCGPELAELWARQGGRTSGTWAEVFGTGWEADEVFMAWAFASYVEALAAAGKAVKALPMYVNAWLGPQPGQPAGGGLSQRRPDLRVLDVWKAAAPSLDLLAPDIYVRRRQAGDGATTTGRTTRCSSPSRGSRPAGCSGRSGTTGRSASRCSASRTAARTASSAGRTPLLGAMAGRHHRGPGRGTDRRRPARRGRSRRTRSPSAGYDVVARARAPCSAGCCSTPVSRRRRRHRRRRARPTAGGRPGAGGHPAVRPGHRRGRRTSSSSSGRASTVDFSAPGRRVEVDQVEEGRFEDGRWVPGRVLNGDERLLHRPARRPRRRPHPSAAPPRAVPPMTRRLRWGIGAPVGSAGRRSVTCT